MRGIRIIQSAIITAVAAAGVLSSVVPASATVAGTASGGSASVVRNGSSITIDPVGECSLAGQQNGSSDGVNKPNLVAFGPTTSTCTTDETAHTSSSESKGTNFTLSALQAYGGPTIKVNSYQVDCDATESGTTASWSFNGLSGFNIPKQIPTNFSIDIKSLTGTVLATVILNEVILPDPNDGSITMNMMHIVLFPNGTPPGFTPLSGDIYVGQTACSPTP